MGGGRGGGGERTFIVEKRQALDQSIKLAPPLRRRDAVEGLRAGVGAGRATADDGSAGAGAAAFLAPPLLSSEDVVDAASGSLPPWEEEAACCSRPARFRPKGYRLLAGGACHGAGRSAVSTTEWDCLC